MLKIKEILDLKENADYKRLSVDEIVILENYITYLQEENKRLRELDENYPIEEQLEEALKYEKIYKSRCEKAVEYIKNNWYSKNTRNIDELHSLGDWRLDLLNIIQGDKDE